MSSVKFASGRDRTVGQSLRYPTPIALSTAGYEGAVVAGEDNLMHYSTGAAWVAVANMAGSPRSGPAAGR